jgi:hypothetical protein
MKKTIIALIGFGFGLVQLTAQGTESISLLLGKPTLGKGIPAQHQSRLETQLLGAFTSREEGSMGAKYSAFAVLPSLEIIERGKVEGMKSKPTIKFSLSMKLQNAYSGEVLEVREAVITGVGANEDEAISKAISGIRRNQPQLGKAMKEFQVAIAAYYEKNCGQILAQSKDLTARQQYQEAFGLLHSVPQGTGCFEQVQQSKNELFRKAQASGCASILAKAQAAQAANDFSRALSLVAEIDAEAPCFDEAKAFTDNLEPKLDEEIHNNYEWLFKFHSAGAEAEAARWNAMNSLFLGWLRDGLKLNYLNQ